MTIQQTLFSLAVCSLCVGLILSLHTWGQFQLQTSTYTNTPSESHCKTMFANDALGQALKKEVQMSSTCQ